MEATLPTHNPVSWSDFVDTDWDQFDFTPYEHLIEIDGAKLNYVELGDPDKPALLYVHGIMGTWRNWIFNLLPFADRYRVIAVDLPGFGRSDMPVGELSIEHYADVIKHLCAKLGIARITLIGNSMGGQVSTIVAKKTPELLQKVILVDPAGFSTSGRFMRRIAPYAKFINWIFALGVVLSNVIAGNRWLAAAFTKIVLYKPMKISSDLMLLLLAGIGKRGFVPAVQTIAHTPVSDFPGDVNVETVIIWGRQDALIPKRDAFKFAKMIPQAKLELMDEVGHIPMFETPDRFNALIERYAPSVQPPAGS
ncbi:MAG: alpha/beta hydrolase [Thermoleophilaceae bacterium]|nr:alpha/beta hydrolase [Thermoleophilaceae bacterium]